MILITNTENRLRSKYPHLTALIEDCAVELEQYVIDVSDCGWHPDAIDTRKTLRVIILLKHMERHVRREAQFLCQN